ncbi:MAG: hypothetical protein PUD78_00305 [Bacteroidales bacterium]|nr:hypothetical protein [Bacteroidales bacterium]
MHKFFITNNLGGGGTNVSRFVDYKALFNLPHIGLLLNYYYLTGHAKPAFDMPIIKSIYNYDNIADFLNGAKEKFSAIRSVSSSFEQSKEHTPINGYMLDNGCGNILRDLLQTGQYNKNSIKKLVIPFLKFADAMKFDFSIALDYAMKYTYKDKENNDAQMKRLWKELAGNKQINLSLIEETLIAIASGDIKQKVYAPLHGFDFESFERYLNSVLQVEETVESLFGGFALGGIADPKKLPNVIWNIPDSINRYIKSGYVVSKLCTMVRKYTDRPIHVLGAGNIYVLPFIINAGATSSDCHSAWRRASDGGYEKAKILIPLLNEKFEFINSKNVLQYVKIKDIDDSYQFDFGYSIKTLKELYMSSNKEDLYFAEILAYYEAIKQYELIIKYTETYPDYLTRLMKSPDSELNQNYSILAEQLY